MKKLNFLCSELSGTGGTETVLIKVLNHLVNNYEITLTLSNIPEEKEWLEKIDDKVKINMFKGKNNISKLLFILKLFLFEKNTDYISLSPKMVLLGSKIKKFLNKKYQVISWFHYSLTDQDMFDTERTLPYADGHLAISRTIEKQLEDLRIPRGKIKLIFNPIEECDVLPETNNSKRINLFYAGRVMLDGQKNLREMLMGIKEIDNVHLDIYGTGEELESCQNYAGKMGVSKKITWHGWTPDLWDKIKERPSALIMTSKYEGLSMVMLETVARGIPVITSKFKSYDDIVKENINGYSYSLGNIKELTKAIEKVANNALNPIDVKNSISEYYPKEYFKRLDSSLEYFLDN